MRSAETRLRGLCAAGLIAAAAALAACSTVSEGMKSMKEAVLPSAAPSTPGAAPAGTRPPAPTPARVAAARGDVPVSAAAQRSFDEATRAWRAGRSADAERGFRALTQSDPELGGPHANLGIVLRAAARLDEAARELERAVELSPGQPVFWNQLGITYRQQGGFAKAKEAYEHAMALDPQYAAPVINLGILSDLYLGDGARALVLYDRYLALSPSGDPAVTKWVAELKNRKPAPITVSRTEKQ